MTFAPLEPRLGDRSLFPDLEAHAYLAHAAISPPSLVARRAVLGLLGDYARRGAGAFGSTLEQRDRLRSKLGALIHAKPGEVALVPNTSLGVTHVAMGFPFERGDRVLCFLTEFPANVTPWQRAAELFGLELAWVDADLARTDPTLFLAEVDAACARGVRLAAVSAVQFQSGLRMPLKAISDRVRAVGGVLFVDGIQACGSVPIDVEADGIDALASGGHKWLMGLEGAGMLYLRGELSRSMRPHLAGWLSHQDAFSFLVDGPELLRYDRPFRPDAGLVEGGAFSAVGCVALEASVDLLAQLGVANIHRHVNRYLDALERELVARGFRSLRGESEAQRSCILGALPPAGDGRGAPWWSKALAARGVVTSCPDGVLRFAPHWPNDIDRELGAVTGALDDARAER
jgi:selenocysteine lyase/cysteine desulfurase